MSRYVLRLLSSQAVAHDFNGMLDGQCSKMLHLHLTGGTVGHAKIGSGSIEALDQRSADAFAERIVLGQHAPTTGDAAAVTG